MANRLGLWAHGAVAVGALTWTFRGLTRVTAVVKAAFDRSGRPCHAELLRPVGAASVGGWGTDGLLHPRDWAPLRPGVDVLVEGPPVSSGSRAPAVTLRIVHRGLPVLEKRFTDLGLPGAGAGSAFGVARLAREPVELPDDFDWHYFHVAPPDQRLAALHGDEQLVLEGLRPEGTLQLAMPAGHAVATLVHAGGEPGGLTIPLVPDTLEIDADRACCALVWRGSVVLASDDGAHSIHAWLEQWRPIRDAEAPDERDETTRIDVRALRSAPRSSGPSPVDADEVTRVTAASPRGAGAREAAAVVLPFRPDAAPGLPVPGPSFVDDEEQGPNSSGTRPMLPIDHLLALGRKAVPYGERAERAARDAAGAPSGRAVVDPRAWVAEHTPRGAPSAEATFELGRTGPSLDDAPETDSALPAILMPTPAVEAAKPEPYDDEVTVLRPGRTPAPASSAPRPAPARDPSRKR